MTNQTQPVLERRYRIFALALLLSLALCFVLTGCLSRPAMVRQNFALQTPAATNTAAAKSERVLAVRSCEVSPLFAGRSFVYRTGPDTYEVDHYAGFLVPPDRAIVLPVRARLRNAGAFKDVVEPGSQLRANTFLEIHVGEFYGDFRKPGDFAAVLTLRLIFYDAATSSAGKIFLQKDYSRRVPVKENLAAAVVAGWNQGLAEIMAEVASDLENAWNTKSGPTI